MNPLPASNRGELAAAELAIRLGGLLRGLRAAVTRRERRYAALDRPEISVLAVTAHHAGLLLAEAESLAADGRAYGPGAAPDPAGARRLADVRSRAAAAGIATPAALLDAHGLGEVAQQVLLLAAAPAIDPVFAALYGYLNDIRGAGAATTGLAVDVLATGADHERRIAEACSPFGVLLADGWLLAAEPGRPGTALHPAPGVAELLRGSAVDAGLVALGTPTPVPGPLPGGVGAETVTALGEALADGRLDVVGVWGPAGSGTEAVAAALLAGLPAVRTRTDGLVATLQRAAMTGAHCVVDVPADDPAAVAALTRTIAASRVPTVLIGAEPARSASLFTGRRYAEVRLPAAGFAERRASWAAAFDWLPAATVDDLAARFRLPAGDVAAVAAMDRAARDWAGPRQRPSIEELAATVSRRRSSRIASIRTPQRRASSLVLPPGELAQVLEVAEAARAWPRVAQAWRLDRFGNPGVTALFAGDPGTGKTLAAEVIAAEVGIDLMVVDLSRLVSKWIGETEKHLDAVFTEAEASSCVLFFDEADSIFGRRGEVSRGADRYANLEVGYLLQRLERYEGLVILASNLRENLDPAFTRRFHHVVHFPRPEPEQRRRLWEIVLAPPVRTTGPVDLDLLATLDLTGAGIAAVVRGAALIAHADGRDAVRPEDLVSAAGRQFRREARLLPRELLAPAGGDG
jgi:hypothetical protein